MPLSKNPSVAHVFTLAAALAAAVAGVGCGGSNVGSARSPGPTPDVAANPALGEVLQSAGPISLHELVDSPSYPGAQLRLVSPPEGSAQTQVPFAFEVEEFELGKQSSARLDTALASSSKGQHIHLVVNEKPYMAHYEPAFEVPLEPGSYRAVAFLSRSHHESVKEPGAFAVTQFSVGEATSKPLDLDAPQLVYSRPKGAYEGPDAEAIMLDFYVLNATLGPGQFSVQATVAGERFMLDAWKPVLMTGLPDGEVDVRLQLLDADGKPVPGEFNDTTRTITVCRSAPCGE